MAQILRPISTITDQGTFSGPSAHGSVDGTAPDTGDYWNGNDNETDVLEVLLTDLSATPPAAGTCTVTFYEVECDTDSAPASGGTTPSWTAEVYEAAVQIATSTPTTASATSFTINSSLTFAAADITDWSDVRFRFTSTGTGGTPANRRGVAVSYVDISAPDYVAASKQTGILFSVQGPTSLSKRPYASFAGKTPAVGGFEPAWARNNNTIIQVGM